MYKTILIALIAIVLIPIFVLGQGDSVVLWEPACTSATTCTFIKQSDNAIIRGNRLDSVFKKLVRVKATKRGTVTIVHIGDSHLQADGMTSVVRNGFHDFFGNAGRGLVFPYTLAGSNSPPDVIASSGNKWESNKIISRENHNKAGLSGFGIHTTQKNAAIHIKLKRNDDSSQEYFNRMVFFLGNDNSCYWLSNTNLQPTMFCTQLGIDTPSNIVETDSLMTGFALTPAATMNKNSNYDFFGVSLERKNTAGVLYHTIGVNGARYDQYLNSELYWEQLAALHADMYVISMGTNEAQNPHINAEALSEIINSFAKRLHKISPNAPIMITTPIGSYFKAKDPNPVVADVAKVLMDVAAKNFQPCWDLFGISGGDDGAKIWKDKSLFSHDLIHFNRQGYQLQGQMLLNAFAKAYNIYAKAHPYKYVKQVVNKGKK